MFGSTGEAGARLEVIHRSPQELVNKAAHIVRWQHEAAFLMNKVTPIQCVVPDVGEWIAQ